MSTIINTSTHYENEFIKIEFKPEFKYVDEIWKDLGEDEQLRQAKLKELEIFKNNNAKGYISDLSGFKGASPEIMEWVNTYWLPAMYETGIRYIAMIFPEDIFGVFTLEQVLGTVYNLVTAEKFKTYNEGSEWIQKYTLK